MKNEDKQQQNKAGLKPLTRKIQELVVPNNSNSSANKEQVLQELKELISNNKGVLSL